MGEGIVSDFAKLLGTTAIETASQRFSRTRTGYEQAWEIDNGSDDYLQALSQVNAFSQATQSKRVSKVEEAEEKEIDAVHCDVNNAYEKHDKAFTDRHQIVEPVFSILRPQKPVPTPTTAATFRESLPPFLSQKSSAVIAPSGSDFGVTSSVCPLSADSGCRTDLGLLPHINVIVFPICSSIV